MDADPAAEPGWEDGNPGAAADGRKVAEPGCSHHQSFRSDSFGKGEDVIYQRWAITP